jgi:hypothetical protein
MSYTVKRLIPEGYNRFRWCVVYQGQIICHRDRWTDALKMARQFNSEGVEAEDRPLTQHDIDSRPKNESAPVLWDQFITRVRKAA